MSFTLEIETKNAAARTAEDIAAMVGTVTRDIQFGELSGIVRDYNGTRVGTWELDLPAPEYTVEGPDTAGEWQIEDEDGDNVAGPFQDEAAAFEYLAGMG